MTCKDAAEERCVKVGLSARRVELYPHRQRVSAERPVSARASSVGNVEEKFSSFKEQKVMAGKTDLYRLDGGWSGIRYYQTVY